MAIYATRQDLIDRDEGMLWNVAIDRASGQLNDGWIDEALEQADAEISGRLSRRYVLPLPSVPAMLRGIAITVAFYWLCDRDQQATNLVEERYQRAIDQLREIASGKLDLGLPTADAPAEGDVGKVELVQEGGRLFTRKSLGGVL